MGYFLSIRNHISNWRTKQKTNLQMERLPCYSTIACLMVIPSLSHASQLHIQKQYTNSAKELQTFYS